MHAYRNNRGENNGEWEGRKVYLFDGWAFCSLETLFFTVQEAEAEWAGAGTEQRQSRSDGLFILRYQFGKYSIVKTITREQWFTADRILGIWSIDPFVVSTRWHLSSVWLGINLASWIVGVQGIACNGSGYYIHEIATGRSKTSVAHWTPVPTALGTANPVLKQICNQGLVLNRSYGKIFIFFFFKLNFLKNWEHRLSL